MTTAEDVEILRLEVSKLTQAIKFMADKFLAQNPTAAPLNPQPTAQLSGYAVQNSDAFGQLRGLIGAFKELRQYDAEVINSYRAVRQEIASQMPQEFDEVEPETMEDKAMSTIFDMIKNKNNLSPVPASPVTKQQETNSLAPIRPGVSNPGQDTISSQNTIVPKPMTDDEIDAWIAKMPSQTKEAVKSGLISFDMAKRAVNEQCVKNGVPLPLESDLRKGYDKIKGNSDGNTLC